MSFWTNFRRYLQTANSTFGLQNIWSIVKYVPYGTLEFYHYKEIYDRGGMGSKLIKIPAEYTWRSYPKLYPQNEDFNDKMNNLGIYDEFETSDRICGIGKYSVAVLGVKGNTKLNKPVKEGSLKSLDDILYVMPYSEPNAVVKKTVQNENDPRFGLPESYNIKVSTTLNGATTSKTHEVHWTRVIHIAEEKDESRIYGTPRIKAVYNRLIDLEKINASSPEAYIRMVSDKILFDLDQNVSLTPEQKKEFDEQMEELLHGEKNYMRTSGVKPIRIETDIIDPKGVFDVIMNSICATQNLPRKFLLGAERGEITSSMDMFSFFDSMQVRRKKFAEREILNPFLNRLKYYGILDESIKYEWKWSPLYELSPKEKAEIGKTIATTIKILATSGAESGMITDLVSREEARYVAGFGESDTIINSIISDMEKTNPKEFAKLLEVSEKTGKQMATVVKYLSDKGKNK